MKKITLFLALMLATVTGSYGQISAYAFSQSSGTYTPITGGTVVASYIGAVASNDRMDDVVYNLPAATIPFTFMYNGTGYDGLNISTNGFITFGATAPSATSYTPISASTAYAGAISAFGRDLEGGFVLTANRTSGSPDLLNASNLGPIQVGDVIDGTGIPAGTTILAIVGSTITMSANATATATAGTVRVGGASWCNIKYVTEGSAPNRVFVVQYSNFKRFGTTLTTVQHMGLNFQFRLNEADNSIQIVYGNSSPGLSTLTTVNEVGLRGADNVFATSVNNRRNTKGTNDNWLNSVQGTVNSSGMVFNNVAPANVIGSGLTYTWTPPNPCTGTPTAGSVLPTQQNLCTGITPANLVATGYSAGVTGLTFQWQESDDNGVGDAWANVVGGSGATTATYTPAAFLGTAIYYRLNVTCTNSGMSSPTASVLIAPPVNPTTQVTALTGVPAAVSATLNWTNGNGGRRVVYLSDSPVFTDPVNGNAAALVANSVYAGSGQQIIYDGTAATAPVTGLTATTTYYVKAYEYMRCGAGPYDYYYNVSTGTNIYTLTTITLPANDDCTGAIALTAGGVFADQDIVGSNIAGTTTAGLTFTCQTSRKDDVWYSVVVPASGSITIETDTTPGTTMTDSVLSVFSGTCGTLTEVGCDDDTGNGNFSKVALTGRTPGETLYIGVWAYTLSGGGDGQFAISAYDASLTATSFDIAGFSAYPNPVKDVLNLSYTKNISSVSIHNLLGQEVLTKAVNATQSKIDMSNLSDGTYLVKVSVDGLVKTLKIVKE